MLFIPEPRPTFQRNHLTTKNSFVDERRDYFDPTKDYPPNTIRDDQAQAIILKASGSPSLKDMNWDFFYDNRSGLPLEDVQDHFKSFFASVNKQRHNPQALCGYNDNEEKRSIDSAVRMCKVNIQATPWGRESKRIDYNTRRPIPGEFWKKSYEALPPFIAFNVDGEKKAFWKLYPNHRTYEIHDVHNIPRPLFITINPKTENCHVVCEMTWTRDDHNNPTKARQEYEEIRQELNRLLGADPGYTNQDIRSPLYIAGWQRNAPERHYSDRRIDTETHPLWHRSIWYEPRGYTLADLRDMIAYLKDLHGESHGDQPQATTKTKRRKKVSNKHKVGNFPLSEQLELADIPAAEVNEGDRNRWLFSVLSTKYCRQAKIAFQYRKDHDAFMNYARPIARDLHSQLRPEQKSFTLVEVEGIVRSIVEYVMSNKFRALGWTSEEARDAANRRWAGHVSVATKAATMGISTTTW
jgi:hypothetical protein